jgi:hypothetical protein
MLGLRWGTRFRQGKLPLDQLVGKEELIWEVRQQLGASEDPLQASSLAYCSIDLGSEILESM